MVKLKDDDPRKWEYSEHTRAKHEILSRYLGAWYSILGRSRAPQLVILDGFAGRGRYTGGEPGSPVLIYDEAVKAVGRGIATKITIACSEANEGNYESLKDVADALEACQGVEIRVRQREFADAAGPIARWLAGNKGTVPTFAFVDPFGFAGVPLDVIRELLAVDHVEVLLTFMARDMSRFLTADTAEEGLTAFFGGEDWRQCIEPDEAERTECLLLRYQEIVRPEIAEYATPFRVFEDERNATLYYLVHLTNHPLGMRRMKEAMVFHSADMTFWPITLRPKDQLALDVDESAPWPSLQEHLLAEYAGRSMSFEELLNEDYPKGVWVEAQYRAAVLDLANREPPPLTITRTRTTKSGRKPRGCKLEDTITLR